MQVKFQVLIVFLLAAVSSLVLGYVFGQAAAYIGLGILFGGWFIVWVANKHSKEDASGEYVGEDFFDQK